MDTLKEIRQMLRSRGRVTLLLAAVNIIVFIALSLRGDTEDALFMLRHGACYAPYVADGAGWRLLTAMFLHFGVVHLLYNMLCLLTLGDLLEKVIGPGRYFVIYLLGGLGGNLLSVLWGLRTGDYAISAGASGAIFAAIGALLLLVIRRRRAGQALSFRTSAGVTYVRLERMGLMVVLMIAQGFLEKGTDNLAHIGGFLAGLVLGLLTGVK